MIPFHLAFPIRDIAQTRSFYVDLLGAKEGRSAARWIDFDFFGHQISAHVAAAETAPPTNEVDGKQVPVRHFGAILPWDTFWAMAKRLDGHVDFVIAPYIRFAGEPGEQATMFFLDPSGNPLEFKAFDDIAGQLFATGNEDG